MKMTTRLALCLLAGALCGCGGGTGEGEVGATPLLLHTFETSEAAVAWEPRGTRFPGLAKFDFGFLNGDHDVSRIIVGAPMVDSGPPILMALSDGDFGPFGTEAPDPVSMCMRFFDLSSVPGASLDHVANMDLAQPLQGAGVLETFSPAWEGVFVLSGFGFRSKGHNHHISHMGVQSGSRLGGELIIHVRYCDSTPLDDHYDAAVMYALVPRELWNNPTVSPNFEGPFEERFSFAGSGDVPRRPGLALLTGFSLSFRSGDRHLERVAIDLDAHARIRVTFRDGDVSLTDDIVDATVKYCIVNP